MNEDQRLQERFAVLLNERLSIAANRHGNTEATRLAVRHAVEAGWAKTKIAATAGISRQTVHEMLKEER